MPTQHQTNTPCLSVHVSFRRHTFSKFQTAAVSSASYTHLSNEIGFVSNQKWSHGQQIWLDMEIAGHRIKRVPALIIQIDKGHAQGQEIHYCAKLQWDALTSKALGFANIILQRINSEYLLSTQLTLRSA